ncbi:MAG TPA: N-acetylmuramoyl-L-alanine amidase [Gemmatimonadaceae bacterium]
MVRLPQSLVAVGVLLLGAGCFPGPVLSPGPGETRPATTPAGAPGATPVDSTTRSPLPAIPSVTGPVAIRVVYPPDGASIAVRDSNFIFGSVGSGAATLAINGRSVQVHPNGSFLAYLPVPASPPGEYRLVVVQGSDTVQLQHRVSIPPPRVMLSATSASIVDSASVAPRGRYALERWEPVRVSIRAAASAAAELQLADGSRVPMVSSSADEDAAAAVFATEVPAVRLNSSAWVQVTRGRDSVRLPLSRIALADSAGKRYARLGAAPSAVPDTDRVIIGRPVAGGTYKWFLIPGTQVEVTGQVGAATRIRLDRDLQVFVDRTEIAMLAPGASPPRRVASNARVIHNGFWTDVRIPMSDIPPYSVDADSRALVLTLYGTTANTDIINFASVDSVVQRVTWRQVTSDRAEYRVELHQAPFGYLVMWDHNALVLRVRQAPAIDPARPLRGLVIAVDAGHPPAGATGPTGLYEPVATLGVAERLRTYLEQRGATVVMTRLAPGAVALANRPVIARRANAHAFVSIHLNAFPDGVNPFERNGTGSYYFNSYSEPLARAVQAGMVNRMGLRDLGVYYDNLAVLRPTWMPSVLCEGAFLMIPEHESALRTAEFQDAYARGVADGVEAYFSIQHSRLRTAG